MTKSQVSVGRSRQTRKPAATIASPAPPFQGRGGVLVGNRAARVDPIHKRPDSGTNLLLRPLEVATTLGLSRSKVFELLAARELPSVRIGRCTRIPRAQLEAWIQAQICWQPQAPGGLLGRLRTVATARP